MKVMKYKEERKYNEESDEGSFLEVDAQYLRKLDDHHNDLHFWLKK